MNPEGEIPQLSMNNTKKEILDAYDDLMKKLRRQKEQKLDAPQRIREKETEEAVTVAEGISADQVVRQIGELKAQIGGLLGEVSDRLESEVRKFDSLRRAIAAKEAQLKEIYGIEREAGSLAALVEAQKVKREEFESDLATRKARLEEEIRQSRAVWEKEKELHAAELVERNLEEKRRRQREQEEFVYEFEKKKRQTRDEFEVEKGSLERELFVRREELDRREADIAGREHELEELRKRIQQAPEEINQAVANALKENSERLQTEARSRQELIQKEFDGERNVLTTRIESLEKTIKEQAQLVARLSSSQDKAYQQVQDIAVKAVENAANIKGLVYQVAESARRKAEE